MGFKILMILIKDSFLECANALLKKGIHELCLTNLFLNLKASSEPL